MLYKNYYNSQNEQHPFHLVNPSPWPLFTAFSLLSLVLSFVLFFNYYKFGWIEFTVNFFILCFFMYCWFYDIILESTYEGHHTVKVQQGIKFGMCLFILSEIMFFFSFFYAYFHSTLSPSVGVGCVWPIEGIYSVDPWGLPLVNSLILLSSGVSVTYAHQAILANSRNTAIVSIVVTIFYGAVFTLAQLYEYNVSSFSINDGIYGSLFFMLTGFHGLHVLVGSIFLFVCLFRQIFYHFTQSQHVGFENAAWYWHFVDVVWLGLFIIVYIWGGDVSVYSF